MVHDAASPEARHAFRDRAPFGGARRPVLLQFAVPLITCPKWCVTCDTSGQYMTAARNAASLTRAIAGQTQRGRCRRGRARRVGGMDPVTPEVNRSFAACVNAVQKSPACA